MCSAASLVKCALLRAFYCFPRPFIFLIQGCRSFGITLERFRIFSSRTTIALAAFTAFRRVRAILAHLALSPFFSRSIRVMKRFVSRGCFLPRDIVEGSPRRKLPFYERATLTLPPSLRSTPPEQLREMGRYTIVNRWESYIVRKRENNETFDTTKKCLSIEHTFASSHAPLRRSRCCYARNAIQ